MTIIFWSMIVSNTLCHTQPDFHKLGVKFLIRGTFFDKYGYAFINVDGLSKISDYFFIFKRNK